MMKLFDFIKSSPNAYFAVNTMAEELKAAGFTRLDEKDAWKIKPGKYFVSAFIDLNNNGVWDTGCYDKALQAEPVYYHPEEIECKAKWDVTRQWNLNATPRYRQKPSKLVKQKPEKEKQLKNRNLERAKELGKEYIKQTGVNL